MIDSTISVGSIITILTVTGTLFFTSGNYTEKIESLQNEQEKTVVRVKKSEADITDLKVSVGKIETQLDDRFDRLEDLIIEMGD